MDVTKVKPYNEESSKKRQIEALFNSIARRYDFLNHLLSFGIDIYWRKKAVKHFASFFKNKENAQIIDIASGTGDLAITLYNLGFKNIYITDLSSEMLSIAEKKVKKLGNTTINISIEDAEKLSFNENKFDGLTVAFGVRNFGSLEKGLSEMNRVLKPGAPLLILEFSKPYLLFRPFYYFHFKIVLPLIGKLFSGDYKAYKYLPDSVNAFPEPTEFAKLLNNSGFTNILIKAYTLGAVRSYTAIKK